MNDLPKDAKYFLNLKPPSVLIRDSPPSARDRELQPLVVRGQCPCQTMKDCKTGARNHNPTFDNKILSNCHQLISPVARSVMNWPVFPATGQRQLQTPERGPQHTCIQSRQPASLASGTNEPSSRFASHTENRGNILLHPWSDLPAPCKRRKSCRPQHCRPDQRDGPRRHRAATPR